MIKHSEMQITGLKIRKDEENRMKKRTGINYGRKYAAITLAAVTPKYPRNQRPITPLRQP